MAQGGQNLRAPLRLPGGEGHLVHRGHQADGVPHGGGVHIVLDELRRHDQRAGGQVREAPGHTGVEDQIHAIPQAQQLRGHGGVHLADAAGAGQNVRGNLKDGNAGDGLQRRQLPGARQGMELRRHGKLQGDFHG